MIKLTRILQIKTLLGKTIPFVLPLFLISCGSFNFTERPAEQSEISQSEEKVNSETDNPSNHLEILSLEAEVSQLKQNLNDLNVQVGQQNQTITDLQKKNRLLENKLANFDNKTKTNKKRSQTVKYKNPENLYKKARQLLLEENYIDAADHFSTFINDHPNHPLADNAAYWLAECHYSQQNFQHAILIFKNLTKRYPKSEKVPDALLKIGYSYLLLDDSNRAHHYLKQVLKKYPFSPAAEKAQIKLGEFN